MASGFSERRRWCFPGMCSPQATTEIASRVIERAVTVDFQSGRAMLVA